MMNNVFEKVNVSAFINQNYNAYSVDVDKDKSGISSKYEVSGLPTFVFLSEKGELLYKGVGYTEADEFLKKGEFSLKKAAGKLTESDLLYECMESDPNKNCEDLLKKYIESNNWKKNEDAALTVIDYALNGNKTALNHVLQNRSEYDKIIYGPTMKKAMFMLAQEEMKGMLVSAFEKKSEPDWKKVEQILSKYIEYKYESYLYEVQSTFYYKAELFSKFLKSKYEYIISLLKPIPFINPDNVGNLIYEETETLIEEIEHYEKKLTALEKKESTELIYNLRYEAENFFFNPRADLYYKLWNAVETFELKEEDYRVYKNRKLGLNADDAKKKVKEELEEE
jgi:hypothetical protein